jgi:hypothetical protein
MLWKVKAQRGIQVLGNIGCCVGVVEQFLDRRADPLEGRAGLGSIPAKWLLAVRAWNRFHRS